MMPCYDERNSSSYMQEHEVKPLREKLNITTQLACQYCRNLDKQGLPIPEYAREWWKAHKVVDEQRRQQEAKQQRGHTADKSQKG